MRGFRCAMSFIQSFSSPAHLAIGVSHCTPLLWNPTLYVTGVPRHTPRGTASPPSGSSPPKNGTKSQQNCDITIMNGPRRCGPDFIRDFLSTAGDPSSSKFFVEILMTSGIMRSETEYLRFPSSNHVDHGTTPRPIDAAVQFSICETWFLTVDPFVRISVFIAKLSERQYCWRVFEDFHSQ